MELLLELLFRDQVCVGQGQVGHRAGLPAARDPFLNGGPFIDEAI